MHWLLPRILTALSALGLGMLVGYVAGVSVGSLHVGVTLGALSGVALAALFDTLRAQRLLSWLRNNPAIEAPRHSGYWGELGYRVERALRSRDRGLTEERERIAQFLSAIEASPNGVLLLDAHGQIEWCNSTAAADLGIDPQRDLYQPLTNLVRAPSLVAQLQEAATPDPVIFSLPGRPGTLSVLIRPYGDGQKLLLSQDITERLRVDEMRRDFVANVSHEIRTPLTVLAGVVESMTHLPLTPTEQQRMLRLMGQQTERMQTLVNDLLILAQLEGGPRPSTDQWVDVQRLMQSAVSDARTLSAGRHEVTLDAGEPAAIAGNEAELASALGNLVTNAIRYTPAQGAVTLQWQRRSNGSGVFEVHDTGPGIAPEHMPRLGERFYRIDGSRSRESGGTGLGLAIAKHAVQRHGGEFEVTSVVGKGSTFRLVFPAARVR